MTTADNNRFLRFWYEVEQKQISIKWFRTHKGGEFRRWYGNDENIVNWENNGAELKAFPGSVIRNEDYYFKRCITWNDISSSKTGFRYVKGNSISNASGPSVYCNSDRLLYILGLCNSKVMEYIFAITCPTIHFEVGRVAELPIMIAKEGNVQELVKDNLELSKSDWDSFEISWDFQNHPLLRKVPIIAEAFSQWQTECDDRFNQLKASEEELNRIFIDIYGLQDELTPEVEDKDITVRKADLSKDIRSFVSYAVGCMFGRYSLDKEGLIYAGGEWDSSRYKTFIPDDDNCIPITDEEYFSDDIVGRFVEFVKTVYGADTLEENLDFIANALGNKGDTSREVIRNYFLKDFYADHLKVYQKRPIYWLFDSGKQNGFKALIYMHRYDADTVGRVRTDYLHRAQKYVETAMQSAQYTIDNASSASEKSKATKAVTKYTKQLAEMKIYDEAIAHIANKRIEIDLDDGVKVNYAKFQGVEVAQEGKKALKVDLLAKIK